MRFLLEDASFTAARTGDGLRLIQPTVSQHFRTREPSAIRLAQIRFASRKDGTDAVNVAIGNVSLPMHPAMIRRMRTLGDPGSPFAEGRVSYTATVGFEETQNAFRHLIGASGLEASDLHVHVTDGGSHAMEIAIVGVCGPPGSNDKPLLLIDPAYTNYKAFADRLGRRTVSIPRTLGTGGKFTLPSIEAIERVILAERPGAVVVIPYDNPTGHYYDLDTMRALARLCVAHDLWIISDEAYRELHYCGGPPSSVWGLSEADVPGIRGRRISIETSSKVWNACGLRIGALVTDSPEFHRQGVAEGTANLCANAIGQHIFGALAHEPVDALRAWFGTQRDYYAGMLQSFTGQLRERMPGIIVSSPDASIYSVVDVRNVAPPSFQAIDFVLYCASRGRVLVDGRPTTLLTAPMEGFYSVTEGAPNPGRTQLRIAYVETPDKMRLVPRLLVELLHAYEAA